ncbi:silent information regulator protein Sir2 [Theileria orientalis]|uniref:Regulatory protein SIR2 homolog 7 n=1 Tax=Theileria orientalis TaxID=68886 RepID=A0A976M3Z6_THEOR|nr:silent information regulator protein Sir2 [Theileria orientalis]
MVSSALNYANRLKRNNNKGPLGQVELFDTSAQVSKKTSLLYDFMIESEMAIVHTGAGVSTGSGIPDFRGPSGIWTIMNTSKEEEEDGENSDGPNEGQGSKRKGRPRKKLTDANCIPTRKVEVEEKIVPRSKVKIKENEEARNKSSSQNVENDSSQGTQDDANDTNTHINNANNTDASINDSNKNNNNADNVNGVNNEDKDQGGSIVMEPVKKKPGRPRKNKEMEEDSQEADETSEPQENYKDKLRDSTKADGRVKNGQKLDGEDVKPESDDSECGEVNKSEYVVYGNKKTKAVEFILALPSEAHLCILQLLKSEKIKFIITQNIDGLHALSGVPFNKLAELHGNVFVQRCLHCARRFQRSYVAPTISFHATGDLCGLCSFPPLNLLTDVVLDWFDCYEEHFENISTRKAEEADFHLSLGTSLHIEPACHYASNDYHRKLDAPLVIVNYQSTKLDPESDLIIHDDVNKVCSSLLKKFDMQIPVFKRKSHLIVLKHQLVDNNCVMIVKMSSISSMGILTDERGTAEYSGNLKNVVDDPPNGFKDGVEWECVNKVQGIYKFTFNRKFGIRLSLFYETQLIVEVPYERVPLFKAEIWELDICATNGSKLKVVPNTFTREKFKHKEDLGSKIGIIGKSELFSDDGLNNDYDRNEVNNLMVIHEMKIRFNSHLIDELPFRMVGYLDLINNRSEEYEEYKVPNSMIMLSYLWGSQKIQDVQKVHYPASAVESYLNVSNQPDELFKSDRSSENDDVKPVSKTMSGGREHKREERRAPPERTKRKKRRYEDDSDYELSSASSVSESSIDHFSDVVETNVSSNSPSSHSNQGQPDYDKTTMDFINHVAGMVHKRPKIGNKNSKLKRATGILPPVAKFAGVPGAGALRRINKMIKLGEISAAGAVASGVIAEPLDSGPARVRSLKSFDATRGLGPIDSMNRLSELDSFNAMGGVRGPPRQIGPNGISGADVVRAASRLNVFTGGAESNLAIRPGEVDRSQRNRELGGFTGLSGVGRVTRGSGILGEIFSSMYSTSKDMVGPKNLEMDKLGRLDNSLSNEIDLGDRIDIIDPASMSESSGTHMRRPSGIDVDEILNIVDPLNIAEKSRMDLENKERMSAEHDGAVSVDQDEGIDMEGSEIDLDRLDTMGLNRSNRMGRRSSGLGRLSGFTDFKGLNEFNSPNRVGKVGRMADHIARHSKRARQQ